MQILVAPMTRVFFGLIVALATACQGAVTVDFDAATGPAANVGDTTVLIDIATDGSATLNSISSIGASNAAAVVSGSVLEAPASPYTLALFIANSNGRQTGIGLMGVGNNHIDPGETMQFSFNIDTASAGSILDVTTVYLDPTDSTADGTITDGGTGSVVIVFPDAGRAAFDVSSLGTAVDQGSGLVNAIDVNGGTVSRFQFAAISFDVSAGVPPNAVPAINTFSASPSFFATGGTSTISWEVSGADWISILPDFGTVSSVGSSNIAPTSSTTYELVATNAHGAVTGAVNVVVAGGVGQPNFLFIAVDDLKPLCGFMMDDPGNLMNRLYPDPTKRDQIRSILTPNIDRLAAGGIAFHRAYCPQTVCGPSRNAIMTGFRPRESGITSNGDPTFRDPQFPEWLRTCTTLPQHLRDHGYVSTGCGKVFHTPHDDYADWTGATINGTFYNSWTMWFSDVPSTGNKGSSVMSPWSPKNFNASSVMNFGYDSGPLEGQGDYAKADFIARLLEDGSVSYNGRSVAISTNQPFFVACGIFRPHLPFYMPEAILNLFDINDISASRSMLDAFYADTADVPSGTGGLSNGDMYDTRTHGNAYGLTLDPSDPEGDVTAYKETVRHYLAAAALADRCVGRVIQGLENSPYRDNTVVVLWSDHGWYLGEKYLFRKTRLFEEASNCVLIFRDYRPGGHAGAQGSACYRTVTLQDLYPTLCGLAGLPVPAHVKGYDISPLLTNPKRPWNIPAQSSDGSGTAIRYGRWSYIDRNGIQLYDVANDPDEIVNLAGNASYAGVQAMMASLNARSIANDPFPERDDDSYESWAFGQWGWYTNRPSLATDNPDGDQDNNGAEYAFFGNPLVAERSSGTPVSSISTNGFASTFKMRDLDSTVAYRVEESTNLVDWVTVWDSSNPSDLADATVDGAGTGEGTVSVVVTPTNDAAFYKTVVE